MNTDEIYIGAYVCWPDYVVKVNRGTMSRPAYLDPPVVGVVQSLHGRDREATVYFPGIGVRIIATIELTHAEHWFIEHGPASAHWEQRKQARHA